MDTAPCLHGKPEQLVQLLHYLASMLCLQFNPQLPLQIELSSESQIKQSLQQ